MQRTLWRAALFGGLLLSGCRAAAGGPGAAPAPVEAAEGRVYEMRTYTAYEGRLDALHRRFRDHTTRIFAKHGMTNIGYWTPQDSALARNTLVYILAHPSRAAAARSWEAFRNDPEWQRVRAESEASGRIVSKVESVFLDPTDYSPLK